MLILRGSSKINHPWKRGYMKSYRYFWKWFQTTTKTNKPLKYYIKCKTDKYVLFYDRNKHNFACSKWKRTKHSHVTRYICPNIRTWNIVRDQIFYPRFSPFISKLEKLFWNRPYASRIEVLLIEIKLGNNLNLHTPDRFNPSHARHAENCGSALTHR